MRRLLVAFIAILGAIISGSTAAEDGKDLYNHFRCGGCHGMNGKGGVGNAPTKSIAGMEGKTVIEAVEKLIARGGHEEHQGASCAEPPSRAQIQAIAAHVSSLPK